METRYRSLIQMTRNNGLVRKVMPTAQYQSMFIEVKWERFQN